jgi:16S rRNA (cytidine1402-2'-O)-methyltransferase
MSTKGTLYLFPNLIADGTANAAIPHFNREVIIGIRHFICEHGKQLRVLLKASGIPSPYDHIEFFELNKHTNEFDISSFLKPLFEGNDMGLVSDAGCPGVADPGAQVVEIAHRNDIKVVPLVGPSSLLLALMASGFNGQQFTFNGYLPQKEKDLKSKLQELERKAQQGSAELFIEAPYRNQKLFDFLMKNLNPKTKLCIAYNIMGINSSVKTKFVGSWQKARPTFQKEPAVFILGR